MKILSTLGGGSCFIHAILLQICPKYNSLNDFQKQNYVRRIRSHIADITSQEIYNKVGDGVLKEVLPYEEWKELMYSNNYLGQECVEMFSEFFRINIFIYYKNMELYPMDVLYKKEYSDVNIYWTGNHYEAISWS